MFTDVNVHRVYEDAHQFVLEVLDCGADVVLVVFGVGALFLVQVMLTNLERGFYV